MQLTHSLSTHNGGHIGHRDNLDICQGVLDAVTTYKSLDLIGPLGVVIARRWGVESRGRETGDVL